MRMWYFEAAPHERVHIQIRPQLWDTPGPIEWDTHKIWELGIQSGITDIAGLADLCQHGVTLPFFGEYSMLLAPCAASFYEDVDIGQSTSIEEVECGWLQAPCMGPPLTPFKVSPRAIARSFKEGKIKDRRARAHPYTHNSLAPARFTETTSSSEQSRV